MMGPRWGMVETPLRRWQLLWSLIALFGGCDDTQFKTEGVVVEGEGYSAVVQVFEGNCTGCHGAGGTFPDLETDVCAALVEQPSAAYDGTLVVASDSAASVLWHKITDNGESGGVMPAGGGGSSDTSASSGVDSGSSDTGGSAWPDGSGTDSESS